MISRSMTFFKPNLVGTNFVRLAQVIVKFTNYKSYSIAGKLPYLSYSPVSNSRNITLINWLRKCSPFCLNSVHYAYFLIQKIYTITFIVFHYGYSWFCNLPFIIIQFPFFPWNWLHTVNKDSVRDILIKKITWVIDLLCWWESVQ